MQKLECKDVEMLIDAFQDNEVDGLTSLNIQEHLDGCARCRSQQWWREETRKSLSRLKDQSLSPSEGLRRRIKEIPGEAPAGRRRVLPVFYQVAALFMVAFLVIFLTVSPLAYSGMDARLFVQNHKVVEESGSYRMKFDTLDPAEAVIWLKKHLPEVEPPRGVPEGYRLVGARISDVDGKGTGLLVYESNGRRISCFVRSGTEAVDRGFDSISFRDGSMIVGRCSGHQIATWSNPGSSVVVVGDLTDPAIVSFAELNSGSFGR